MLDMKIPDEGNPMVRARSHITRSHIICNLYYTQPTAQFGHDTPSHTAS
jgi:hypothetical protein